MVSYFEPHTPEWIKNCFIYNRPSPKTGTGTISTRTGNVMVRSSLLRSVEAPFEPAYGITGGEDTKLFSLLKKGGAKYINSYEAVTYEYVPRERTKIKWLIIRAFKYGNHFARRQVDNNNNKFVTRVHHLTIGVSYFLISMVLSFIFIFNKTNRLKWFLKLVSNFGKIAAVFGYHLVENEL